MKANRLLRLPLASLLVLDLAGCAGTASGAAVLVPLNPTSWPTATPVVATPSPTPFPRITLTPTRARTVLPATATLTATAAISAPTGTPAAPAATPEAGAMTATVRARELNLRKGPGTAYGVLAVLHAGDPVSVQAANGARDWLLVDAQGRQGWVSASLLSIAGGLDRIPQASPASIPTPPALAPTSAISPTVQAAAGRPAGAAAPAAALPGHLVFQLASGGDILIVDGGGAPRRLTSGIDPALSPDGRQVAFTRWQGDAGSLWVIGVDGRGERQLVSGLRKAKGAEWSPDGQRIVFNYQHEGRLQSQWVCKPYSPKEDTGSYGIPWNASDVKVRVFGNAPYLCWTIPSDEHWALHVVSSSDGKGDDLYAGMYAFRPTWDPVRTWRIVDEAGDGLRETSVNADHTQKITDKVEDHSPVFSPDGQYLAVAYDTGGRWDIFRLNADGSGRVRLTDMPLWNQVGPDKQAPWHNVAPAWSPDGRRLAYLTDRTGRWEIWSMNADGSDQRPLFDSATNDSLPIKYDYNDERVMSWR